MGSVFTTVAASSAASSDGVVDEGTLQSTLLSLWKSGREQLAQMGRLAVGRANEGEDYSWLPHQSGTGGSIPDDNPSKFTS